jgi:hypothetical protein
VKFTVIAVQTAKKRARSIDRALKSTTLEETEMFGGGSKQWCQGDDCLQLEVVTLLRQSTNET